MMNDSTTIKEKPWVYPIFFLIGILSFPLSIFFGAILASANILILEGLFQLLFPLVICSILFAILLYTFKERSIRFASQVFVISLVTSILIFMGGSFGLGLLIPIGLFLPLFPLVFLLILSVIGLFVFKDRPFVSFTVKAFTISFFTLFLIVGGWFMLGAYEHEYGTAISIKKFDAPQGEYAEVTAEELKGYPALEKALSGEGCTKYESNEDSWYCKVDPKEWRPMLEFFEKKRHESGYLFSIMGVELDAELNKRGAVPAKLKDIFESKGFPLSENALIHLVGVRWDIIERQYLFSIMDAELERELNKIEVSKEAGILKLRSAFESKGISLSEYHRVLRMTENWIVIDEGGLSYEIWNEGGKLNVYTQETRPYEIWKEEGRLNVYDRRSPTVNDPLFKINEKYYKIGFMTE